MYTYTAEQMQAAKDDAQNEGRRRFLGEFFGVWKARHNTDGTIECVFRAESSDGAAIEERRVLISPENTPERNAAILLDARARQAWYIQERENVPGIPVPPQEDVGGQVLDLSDNADKETAETVS